MSRENAATAAQWRAARESRSSSVRMSPERTPHDRFAYWRVRSRAVDHEPRHVREADDVEQDEDQRGEAELGVDLRDHATTAMLMPTGAMSPFIDRRSPRQRGAVEQREQQRRDEEVQRHRHARRRRRAAAANSTPDARRVDRLEGDGDQQHRRRRAGDVDHQRAPAVALHDPRRGEGDCGMTKAAPAQGRRRPTWPRRRPRRPSTVTNIEQRGARRRPRSSSKLLRMA